MLRTVLSLVVLASLMAMHPASAQQAPQPVRSTATSRGWHGQHQHRVGNEPRKSCPAWRQNRRAHRRVPPEERAVQEDRGADERPRHRREELR